VAPEAGAEVRAWATAGRLVLREREFEATDLAGAWLALTATDDAAVNAAVHAAGEAARVWVNSADDPVNCSFTLMSVIRRGDLVVSVGTGGRSPALAAELRRRLGEEIGPEYETLLDVLSEAREALRATGRSSEDANWQSAFDGGIVELVRTGRIDDAKELLRTCLSSSSA
jgi:siroheme synthase-like protein